MHEVDVGLSIADLLLLYLVLRLGDHALCVRKGIFDFAVGKQCKHLDPLVAVPLRKLHLEACFPCLWVHSGPRVPKLLLFPVLRPPLAGMLLPVLPPVALI